MLSASSPRLIEARFDWGDGRSPGSRIDTLHGLPGISSGIACGFTVFSCGGSRGIAPRSRFTLDGHHHARMIKQFGRAPPFRPLQTGPIGQFGGSHLAAGNPRARDISDASVMRSKQANTIEQKKTARRREAGHMGCLKNTAEEILRRHCEHVAQSRELQCEVTS